MAKEIVNIRVNFERNFCWVDYVEDGQLKELCLWEVMPVDGQTMPDGMIYQNPGNYYEMDNIWNGLNGTLNLIQAFIDPL